MSDVLSTVDRALSGIFLSLTDMDTGSEYLKKHHKLQDTTKSMTLSVDFLSVY